MNMEKSKATFVNVGQKEEKKTNEQRMRIYTGLALIAGVILVILMRSVTHYVVDAVLLVAMALAVYEVMKAAKIREKGIKEVYVWAYLIVAYIVFFLGTIFDPTFGVLAHIIAQLIVLFTWSLYTFLMYYVDKPLIRRCKLEKKTVGAECRRVMKEYFKIISYPAMLFFALFAINHLGTSVDGMVQFGLFGLLLVVAISSFTDIFAYAVGSTLRGPKLLPEKMRYISPNKTISGAIGGMIGGWTAALLLVLIFSGDTYFSDFMTLAVGDATSVILVFSLVGVLGSIMTQFGDLFASYFKRKHGIKDFGNYLPGHGGVMDRMDGISFNAVLIFISMLIIVAV